MFVRFRRSFRPLLLCSRCLTYYEVLDVPQTASKADIKKAYLDKAKELHPDLNPGNEQASSLFQQLQEAHDVLMDSNARARYNARIQQQSYYGNQRTHRSDSEPMRQRTNPNIRRAGVNNPYYEYQYKGNVKFNSKHRSNADNYRSPGSQKWDTAPPFGTPPETFTYDSADEDVNPRPFIVAGLVCVVALACTVGTVIYTTTMSVAKRRYRHREEQLYDRHKDHWHQRMYGVPAMELPEGMEMPQGMVGVPLQQVQRHRPSEKTAKPTVTYTTPQPKRTVTKTDLLSLKNKVKLKREEYLSLKKEFEETQRRYKAENKLSEEQIK